MLRIILKVLGLNIDVSNSITIITAIKIVKKMLILPYTIKFIVI